MTDEVTIRTENCFCDWKYNYKKAIFGYKMSGSKITDEMNWVLDPQTQIIPNLK